MGSLNLKNLPKWLAFVISLLFGVILIILIQIAGPIVELFVLDREPSLANADSIHDINKLIIASPIYIFYLFLSSFIVVFVPTIICKSMSRKGGIYPAVISGFIFFIYVLSGYEIYFIHPFLYGISISIGAIAIWVALWVTDGFIID